MPRTIFFIVASSFLLCLPAHFLLLWNAPQYQFFPVLLLGISGILYERIATAGKSEVDSFDITFPFSIPVLTGLILLLFSIAIDTPNVAMFGFMVFTGGYVWQAARVAGKNYWGPWLLGWLLVQLPGFVERNITQSLQLFSSKVSGVLLDWLGVNHLMTGNVLHLPGQDLFVDEACSGVVSLISMLAFGAMYIVWNRYGIFRASILLTVGVLCAILLNVLRITIVALSDQWFDFDLVHGNPHTLLGILLFAGTLTVFYYCDQILDKLLWPVPMKTGATRASFLERTWNRLTETPDVTVNSRKKRKVPTGANRNRVVSAVMIFLAAAIVVLATGRAISLSANSFPTSESGEPIVMDRVDADLLGDDVELEFDHITRERLDATGQYSKVFKVGGENGYDLSIDYTFKSQWHELTNCYEVLGWSITDRHVIDNEPEPWGPWVEVDLTNPQGEVGFLLFSLVGVDGSPVYTPDKSSFLKWTLFEMSRRVTKGFKGETIQFQLWCPRSEGLSLKERDELTEEFLEFREHAMRNMFQEQGE